MATVLRPISKLTTGKLGPIYPKQIVPEIRRIFFNGKSQTLTPRLIDGKFRIGVCVGGGPSSMALAYLLKNMPRDALEVPIEIVAFVMDESSVPVSPKQQQVWGWLNQIGVEVVEPLTARIEAWTTPADKLSAERRAGLLNRLKNRLSFNFFLLGTNMDDEIDSTIRSLIAIHRPSFLDLRGNFQREELLSSHGTSYSTEAAGNPLLAFLRTQHVFTPGGRPPFLTYPVNFFREAQLIETCETFRIPYAKKERQLVPSDGGLGVIRQLREQYALPQALSDRSIYELKTRSLRKMRDIKTVGKKMLETFRIVSWDLRFGSMCFEVPQIQGALSPIELSAYAWALGTLCSAVRRIVPKPWDFGDIRVLHAIFPGIEHDDLKRSTHRSKKFVCSNVLFEMVTEEKTVGDLGANVWRITYRPSRNDRGKTVTPSHMPAFLGWKGDHELQGNEPRWALKQSTVSRQSPPSTETKPWALAKWARVGWLWWVRLAVWPLDALQHVRIEVWGRSHDFRVKEAVKAAPKAQRDKFQQTLLEIEPKDIKYNLPILTFKEKVCGFPTLDMVFTDHLTEPLEIKWLVQYKSYADLSTLLNNVKMSDHLKHEMYRQHHKQPHLTGE